MMRLDVVGGVLLHLAENAVHVEAPLGKGQVAVGAWPHLEAAPIHGGAAWSDDIRRRSFLDVLPDGVEHLVGFFAVGFG